MCLLHRRLYPGQPGERLEPGADDRGGACGRRDPRRGLAGPWRADAQRSRETEYVMSLRVLGHPLASAVEQLRVLNSSSVPAFDHSLAGSGLHPLSATGITVFQINVGKLCNQTCKHCHVDAGPDRREIMTRETMDLCLSALARTDIPTVDITGGAPELNPHFRWLVEEVSRMRRRIIDRCNLTVLLLPGEAGLAAFLAAHEVGIIASLPYYLAER